MNFLFIIIRISLLILTLLNDSALFIVSLSANELVVLNILSRCHEHTMVTWDASVQRAEAIERIWLRLLDALLLHFYDLVLHFNDVIVRLLEVTVHCRFAVWAHQGVAGG